jgi:hypothetical protein
LIAFIFNQDTQKHRQKVVVSALQEHKFKKE